MKFEKYAQERDAKLLFESLGFDKSDVLFAAQAMQEWVHATNNLFALLNKIPEVHGDIGGYSQQQMSETPLEQEITLEVQKVKNLLEDSNLSHIVSQLNQYNARLNTACERLISS